MEDLTLDISKYEPINDHYTMREIDEYILDFYVKNGAFPDLIKMNKDQYLTVLWVLSPTRFTMGLRGIPIRIVT